MKRRICIALTIFSLIFAIKSYPGGEPTAEQQCNVFEQLAQLDDAMSQVSIAHCYRTGEGRQQNLEKAELWLKAANNQGLVQAEGALGALYLLEFSDSRHHENAILLLDNSSRRGLPSSYFNLAIAYQNGFGVAKDPVLAKKNLGSAAKLGHGVSAAILYLIYRDGLWGNEPDKKFAANWKEKANELAPSYLESGDYIRLVEANESIRKYFGVRTSSLGMSKILLIEPNRDD